MIPSILRCNFISFANQRVSLMRVGSATSLSKVRSFGKEARECIVSKPKRKDSLEKIININKTLEENKRKMKEELDELNANIKQHGSNRYYTLIDSSGLEKAIKEAEKGKIPGSDYY